MKKWTFFDQMLASFLVIVISSILSALLHLPHCGPSGLSSGGGPASFSTRWSPVSISIQWGARALWFPPPAGGHPFSCSGCWPNFERWQTLRCFPYTQEIFWR